MPGRNETFKTSRIRESIYSHLIKRMDEEGFVGGFSPYVESLCQKVVKGLLVDRKEVEGEIREQIYAELAAEGVIVSANIKREQYRKAV